MYCPDCRQERLGNAQQCALCGKAMHARSRTAVEAELAHVHFLLDELRRWDTSEVPRNVSRFIAERYERQARILLAVLTELPPEAVGQGMAVAPAEQAASLAAAAGGAPSRMGESAVVMGAKAWSAPSFTAPADSALGVEDSARADGVAAGGLAQAAASTDGIGAQPSQVEVGTESLASNAAMAAHEAAEGNSRALASAAVMASQGAEAGTSEEPGVAAVASQAGAEAGSGALPSQAASMPAGASARREDAGSSQSTASEATAGVADDAADAQPSRAPGLPRPRLPLPENPAEAYAEPPQPRSLTARLVEETSTWNRVWRPFLYESIMWFVGAFLILSGTLYFVFESWAGMSSSVRSLTVFGMTAGYSAGFSVWGAYLARREALRNPGNILGLIGSAVAPLAGIALGPLDLGEALQFSGVGPLLLIPMLLAWAAVAAVLVRKPAEAFDSASRPLVQAALAASTLMMGLAPLAVKLGTFAPWLNALPCALFFFLSSRSSSESRRGTSLFFAVAAPLYLFALYVVRLHVGLADVGVDVVPGTYAPFVVFLLATALRSRTLEPDRVVDPLTLGVVPVQVAFLLAAASAPAPAFFATAAVLTWTLVSLARGGIARLPWVYGAYASTYFSYASSAQLIPGPVRRFIDALKAQLGYPATGTLPLQYGALSAVPFVAAGAALAVWRLWRGEHTRNERDIAFAEVMLRATAVASPLFALYGMAGPDARPAFWSALGLALVCLTVGLLVERFYLTAVGAGVAMFLPFQAFAVLGAPGASVASGVMALLLSAVCLLCTSRTRWLLASVVAVMTFAGFLMGIFGGGTLALTGVVLCGAAALITAWHSRVRRPWPLPPSSPRPSCRSSPARWGPRMRWRPRSPPLPSASRCWESARGWCGSWAFPPSSTPCSRCRGAW
ncbi:hypothetical protein ACLESD_29235 [Pyxidicoccus sp. 3LFB2]